ncbi:hypothetical protein HYALB_00005010 [Hymenoscyphus albidus]|uniref:Uncharacterized protein n=1 Tax=Hymenoscyphus albidus TaxID=595503 RepID=A0A9N9LGM4_9HELO|nr:hypothetical protein HYALB_00005010 [Hymenoscyphus albidus]
MKCDGYTDTKIKRAPPRALRKEKPDRPLLIPIAPASRISVSSPFQDHVEYQYFRLFCDESSERFSDSKDNYFWKIVIPQACHAEDCVKKCVIALVALDRAYRSRQLCLESESESPASEDSGNQSLSGDSYHRHRNYALRKYGRAILGVQDMMERGTNNVRLALIAAFLIYSFEILDGNIGSAINQLCSAVKLLYRDPRFQEFSRSSVSTRLPTVDSDISTAMSRVWLDCTKYTRVEIKRNCPNDIRKKQKELAELQPNLIPFSTLREAQATWDALEGIVSATLRGGGNLSETSKETDLVKAMQRWAAAFEPIMRQAQTFERESDLVGTLSLRAQWLRCQFGLLIRTGTWSISLRDQIFSIFKEFVALGRLIVKNPSFQRGFTVATGMMPILFVVALRCRRTQVGEDALEVLRDMRPRREGFWDSISSVRIVENMINSRIFDDFLTQEDSGTKLFHKDYIVGIVYTPSNEHIEEVISDISQKYLDDMRDYAPPVSNVSSAAKPIPQNRMEEEPVSDPEDVCGEGTESEKVSRFYSGIANAMSFGFRVVLADIFAGPHRSVVLR